LNEKCNGRENGKHEQLELPEKKSSERKENENQE
jgi:hypothetical protein